MNKLNLAKLEFGKKKIFFIVLILLFSLAAIFIGTYYVVKMRQQPSKSSAGSGVSLYFDPANPTLDRNSNFTLNIKVNPGSEKITAAELYLTFDKDKIQITSIGSVPAFSAGVAPKTFLKDPVIDNKLGKASVIVGVLPEAPVGSVSDVVIVKGKTKAISGNALITITQDSKAAAIGKTSNVIKTYGQASLNITAPTNTPTPTATPTPTPTAAPTNTPTPTPTQAPQMANLTFKVKFQGINTHKPDKTVRVTLKNGSVFDNVSVSSDTSGVYSGTVSNITPGTFEVLIKGSVYLQKNFGSVTFVADQTVNKDWSGTILMAGDFIDDNKLNVTDIAAILAKYVALSIPADGTNRIYDVDSNNVINISDIALILANYTALEIPGDN